MMWSKTPRRRANLSRRTSRVPECHFEALEDRMVLYQSPMVGGFVPLTSLENRNNSVVRILTNVGRIDIELFEALVPSVTANFRNYIQNGSLDESFFHVQTGGTLQGGGYRYDDITHLTTIPALTPIPNGFSRSNLAQTIAMVPINSTQATSKFIINLQDNLPLNTQSGGFTVFGKVIQGWSVVQAIEALSTQNLNQALLGTGTGPFNTVPVTGGFDPLVGPTEATLIKIIDVETIKAPGLPSYYGKEYVYAEGSRSATSVESITFVNESDNSNPPPPDLTNYFQVVVRYESGIRDTVIYSGSIPVGGRFELKVNDVAQPGLNLVRSGERYTYSVRSTKKMGVSFNHSDSSVILGESFLMTPQIPAGQFTSYQFGQATKGTLDAARLVVENLGGQNSTININVYSADGNLYFFAIDLEAFRGGSLDFSTLTGLPDGDFSVWATSLSPFAASMSIYKTGGGGNASDGSTSQGVQGGGRVEGALGGAYLATGAEAHVDVLYTGITSVIIVDFTITLSNNSVLTPSPMVLTVANRRGTMDLSTVPSLPRDEYFTIQYSERTHSVPISATYRTEIGGDEVRTPFQINATTNAMFADGFSDPTLVGSNGMSETISIFNPYASFSMGYDLLFHFSDGSAIFAYAGTPPGFQTLAPLRRRDHVAMNIPVIAAKINADPAFHHYSVEIVAFPFTVGLIGGVVAQMTRVENSLGSAMTTIPSWDPSHTVVYMDNAEFD